MGKTENHERRLNFICEGNWPLCKAEGRRSSSCWATFECKSLFKCMNSVPGMRWFEATNHLWLLVACSISEERKKNRNNILKKKVSHKLSTKLKGMETKLRVCGNKIFIITCFYILYIDFWGHFSASVLKCCSWDIEEGTRSRDRDRRLYRRHQYHRLYGPYQGSRAKLKL